MLKEVNDFLCNWGHDSINAKSVFSQFADYLDSLPDAILDFKERPGISYSLRAKNAAQKNRDLFVLVDIVDDEPDNRWLSVCFYADMVSDPQEIGDFVPDGLMGENAMCFNYDENNENLASYIGARLKEAAEKATS